NCDVAAVEADDHVFAALDQAVIADTRALRRADKIDNAPGAAIGHVDDLLRRVGCATINHRTRTRFLRGIALAWIDVDDDGTVAAHRLVQGKTHQPKTAGANNHGRFARQRGNLFQGAVSRY